MKQIGIDLGGHTITAGSVIFEGDSAKLLSRITAPTPAARGLLSVIGALEELILMWAAEGEEITVGIGVPGFISLERDKIVKLTNFTGCDGAELGQLLSSNLRARKIKARVLMENDANCAALGEGLCGAAAGLKNYAVLTLGTGIGCGIITEGRLLRGAHGMAAEAGHIAVSDSGTLCRCGGRGHLEGAASADWIERRAAEAGLPADFRALWNMREKPEAQAVLEPAIEALARGIASIYALLDPEAIILSGGMSRAVGLREVLLQRIPEFLAGPFTERLDIRISAEYESAAVVGAASLCHTENS